MSEETPNEPTIRSLWHSMARWNEKKGLVQKKVLNNLHDDHLDKTEEAGNRFSQLSITLFFSFSSIPDLCSYNLRMGDARWYNEKSVIGKHAECLYISFMLSSWSFISFVIDGITDACSILICSWLSILSSLCPITFHKRSISVFTNILSQLYGPLFYIYFFVHSFVRLFVYFVSPPSSCTCRIGCCCCCSNNKNGFDVKINVDRKSRRKCTMNFIVWNACTYALCTRSNSNGWLSSIFDVERDRCNRYA